jgi:hypothetical protein
MVKKKLDLMRAAEPDLLEYLKELRIRLLRLHKALLDAEKISYEKRNGRMRSMSQFLEMAMHDEWFAWLRPMVGLIIEMDVALEEELVLDKRVQDLIALTTVLLKPKRLRTDFYKKIHAHLQNSPDVVVAFGAVSQLLTNQTTQ